MPFTVLHMDQHRPVKLLGPLQHVAQPVQIMAVDRPQVGKAHILKQGAAGPEGLFQGGFEPVVKPVDGRLPSGGSPNMTRGTTS